jgi:hypothetical protein
LIGSNMTIYPVRSILMDVRLMEVVSMTEPLRYLVICRNEEIMEMMLKLFLL